MAATNPTADDWTRVKPRIEELYLNQHKQLKEVRRIMLADHGFSATERMYKSRLKGWQFDTKKIREPDWRHMLYHYRLRQLQGKDTIFIVHGKRKCYKDILKYLKRRSTDADNFLNAESKDTLDICSRPGIRYHTPCSRSQSESISDESSDHYSIKNSQNAALHRNDYTDRPTASQSSPHFPSLQWSQSCPQPHHVIPNIYSWDTPGIHTPQPIAPAHRPPDYGYSFKHNFDPYTITDGTWTYHPPILTDLPMSPASSSQSVCGIELVAVRALTPSRAQALANTNEEVLDYRLMSTVGVAMSNETKIVKVARDPPSEDLATVVSVDVDYFQDNVVMRVDSGDISISQDLSNGTEDAQLLMASKWAARYFLACIAKNQNNRDAERAAILEADGIFMGMLKTENKYLLSGLSMMFSIISSHDQRETLDEFLARSCETIHTVFGAEPVGSQKKGVASGLEVIYRFARATTQYNDTAARDINHWGNQLEHAADQFEMIWGKDSPNWLVAEIWHAWYLLRIGNLDEAIGKLEECLRIAERQPGTNDLLTVNCLSPIARAYKKKGQFDNAIKYQSEAVRRCHQLFHTYSPFRLRLLGRLGYFHACNQQLAQAEVIYQEVVTGRIYSLGLGHNDTEHAIEYYHYLLTAQGKDSLAAKLVDNIESLRNKSMNESEGAASQPTVY